MPHSRIRCRRGSAVNLDCVYLGTCAALGARTVVVSPRPSTPRFTTSPSISSTHRVISSSRPAFHSLCYQHHITFCSLFHHIRSAGLPPIVPPHWVSRHSIVSPHPSFESFHLACHDQPYCGQPFLPISPDQPCHHDQSGQHDQLRSSSFGVANLFFPFHLRATTSLVSTTSIAPPSMWMTNVCFTSHQTPHN